MRGPSLSCHEQREMTALLRLKEADWLTPGRLFERFLEVVWLDSGGTIKEEREHIEGRLASQDQILAQTHQTAEDLALYNKRCQHWERARDDLMAAAEREIMRAGSIGAWLAVGRRSPFHDEELIPPRFWDFLSLDQLARKAWNEKLELEFAGLKCVVLQELPREFRRAVLLELDELDLAIQDGRYEGRIKGASESKSNLAPSEQPVKAYVRVWDAFEGLPEDVKEWRHEHGGKTKIIDHLSEQLPGLKRATVEREFRNVLQFKGLSRKPRNPEN